MTYTRRYWQNNPPSSNTPISASALNNIENGIQEALDFEDRIVAAETDLKNLPRMTDEFYSIKSEIDDALPEIDQAHNHAQVASNSANQATLASSELQDLLDSVTQSGFVLASPTQDGLMSSEDKAAFSTLLSEVQAELGSSANVVFETPNGYVDQKAGRINFFVGTSNPSDIMDPDTDVWLSLDGLTRSSISTDILNPGSDIGAAVRSSAIEVINIPLSSFTPSDSRAPAFEPFLPGSPTQGLACYVFPPSVERVVATNVYIPETWSRAKFTVYWSHEVEGTTRSVRWLLRFRPLAPGVTIGGSDQTVSSTSEDPGTDGYRTILTSEIFRNLDSVVGGHTTISIYRNGGNSLDTLPGDVKLVGFSIEKVS